MRDVWEVLQLVFMGLLVLLFVWAVLAVALWAAQWAARLWEQIELAWVNIKRGRADAKLVTMRPGEIKIPRADLKRLADDIARAQFEMARTHIDAMRLPPPVPHSIHYAPHYAYRNDTDVTGQIEGPAVAALLQQPADFWSLFHRGELPEHGFLMGYSLEDSHPVTADWRKLYSALIGGQSGSGKSTLVRSILAQSALQGGRFVVIDPHMGSGDESLAESLDPLRRLMLCEPAGEDEAIRDALRYVENVGRARLAGKDTDRSPLILVVDELTGMLTRGNVADDLLRTLGMIAQETRKVGVYALAIGQQFSSQVMSTPVRNSFVSFLSCRARRDVAKVMSGSNEFGKLAEGLTVGQAVWMTPAGEVERVSVPNTTAHHLELVAKTLDGHNYTCEPGDQQATNRLPLGVQAPPDEPENEGGGSQAEAKRKPSGSLEITDAKVAHVRRLLNNQMPFPEIIREVWSVTSAQGRKYQSARAEFEAILYSLIGGANG